MLSKVLTGTDVERAKPAVFSTATAAPPPASPRREERAEDEEASALRARVHRLEADLVNTRQEGFDAGLRQGEQKTRAELTPIIERMTASIAELAGLRDELRRRAEKDVIQLALLISRRILHRELNVDAGALSALARVIFERLARAESYRVSVNPAFVSVIQAAVTSRLASRIEIDADPGLAPGAFIIHSSEGTIDASVDTQLDEIGRGLADRLGVSLS